MKKSLPKGRQYCAWPDCSNEGSFPAPCDPKDLRKRVYLCSEHITLYNKAWNGLDGFTSDEIFNMQQNPSWDKPTWKLGKKQKLQESIFAFSHSKDKNFKGFDYLGEDFDFSDIDYKSKALPHKVQHAMAILNVKEPLDKADLKKSYKKLVKKHHPDVVKDTTKAEEELKQINLAYQYLKEYIKRTAQKTGKK